MNTDIEKAYDSFAETYEKNRGLFDMSELINQFEADLQVDDGHLLDLGCGAGEPFSKFFVDNGWSVTGVDLSLKMLELANRYAPQMNTIHSNMTEVDFKENSFDAIIAIYSLFHAPREKHPQLFSRIYKWLISGGKVLFTYAGQEYTGSETFSGTKEFMGQKLFYSHDTPEELNQKLKSAGFKICREEHKTIGGETFLWVTAEK